MWATIAPVVGITLVVGWVLTCRLARRRVTRRRDVFRCRVRLLPSTAAPPATPWPPRDRYGEWVHDVLILHYGPLLGATAAVPVRFPEGVIDDAGTVDRPKRLPLALRLRLDD